jgi:hypothetical protein
VSESDASRDLSCYWLEQFYVTTCAVTCAMNLIADQWQSHEYTQPHTTLESHGKENETPSDLPKDQPDSVR